VKSAYTVAVVLLTSLVLAIPPVATATPSNRVERVLRAKILSGDGIYAPFVGGSVTVTIIYDRTLEEFGSPGGLANNFRNFSPAGNVGKAMGIEVAVGGIVRTTEGAADDHKIDMQDTEFLDQWSMDVVDMTSLQQASITLRGGPGYLLAGTGGLTGDVDVFPPDVCDSTATLTIGNFGTDGAGGTGSMTYDFRQGPDCTGVTTTTTTTTTSVTTTTTMPPMGAECGDPVAQTALSIGTAGLITASDALFTLSAAVGSAPCDPCICDVNNSGSITATDALFVLNSAVSLPVVLECPSCECPIGQERIDGVCLPICGNGMLDPGEQCDDGNSSDIDGCTHLCRIPFCGDEVVEGTEECDDGNTVNDDDCTNACVCISAECALCGNGLLDPGEECDDGDDVNADECTNFCTLPICGDGIVQPDEDCDDGNNEEGDTCPSNCMQ
jgi:cysteine-rich repeat protein